MKDQANPYQSPGTERNRLHPPALESPMNLRLLFLALGLAGIGLTVGCLVPRDIRVEDDHRGRHSDHEGNRDHERGHDHEHDH